MTEIPGKLSSEDTAALSQEDYDQQTLSEASWLYNRYSSELLKGIRRRYGPGPPDPEDVVQETFRRIYDRSDWSSIDNMRAFLWRTACNYVRAVREKNAVREKYAPDLQDIFLGGQGRETTPETVLLTKHQLAAINALLKEMPERRRMAFYLYRIEGLTQEQIARRLGISRGSVSKHLIKVNVAISALFVDEGED